MNIFASDNLTVITISVISSIATVIVMAFFSRLWKLIKPWFLKLIAPIVTKYQRNRRFKSGRVSINDYKYLEEKAKIGTLTKKEKMIYEAEKVKVEKSMKIMREEMKKIRLPN